MACKVFDCWDAFGNKVSCSTKSWKHITDKRPELGVFKGLIINAMVDPDFICHSRLKGTRYTFYKSCLLRIFKKYEQYLRLVIQYDGNLDDIIEGRMAVNLWGELITVIPVAGTQLGEVTIWRKQPI